MTTAPAPLPHATVPLVLVSGLTLPPGVVGLDLRVEAGECAALTASREVAASLADLIGGMVEPRVGTIAVFGEDWRALSAPATYALRRRIGRLGASLTWVQNLNVDENVVMPMLDRTQVPEARIREDASALARQLGLDGLPRTRPHHTSPRDLAASAAVRAFLGTPELLLVEPVDRAGSADLRTGLVALAAAACARGAAVVWFCETSPPADLPAGPRKVLADGGRS